MSSALPRLAEAMDPPSKEQDEENSEAESDDSFNSYDAMASEYAKWPVEIARAAWMKELVENHKGWIGFDRMGSAIKALDYCAGTGFFSQALAPHVHKILGIDSAQNMTIEYNKIAEQTKDEHPNCEMQAVWGDLIQGEEPEDEAWASDVEFDLIAMSLAVNFFACPCCGIPGLQTTLQTMTSRLKHNGTLLILDIQKDYATTHETEESDALNQTLRKGKKISGCGNEEIATALEGLGMEDVVVLEEEDLSFRFENVLDGVSRVTTDEVYYLLKAKKGLAYHEDVDDGSQADG